MAAGRRRQLCDGGSSSYGFLVIVLFAQRADHVQPLPSKRGLDHAWRREVVKPTEFWDAGCHANSISIKRNTASLPVRFSAALLRQSLLPEVPRNREISA